MTDRLEAAIAELAAAVREAAGPPPAAGPDRLLGLDEAGAMLGIGRSRLYAELDAGRLRSVKVGRRRLVPGEAIAAFISRASA